MSKLYKGEINFSVGIKQTGAVPLDDRTVVATFNDLLSPDTFGLSAYAGMLVAVLENKQVFMLVDKAKPNLPKSWVAVGDLSEADIKDIEDKIDEVKKISTGNSEDIKNIKKQLSDVPFEKGEAENSAVLRGGNNQVISEGGVALGKDNFVGLKGWYYKAVQIGNDSNVVYLYLTTEQQIPILVSTANAVENQEKDININISKGDICSIINGNRLIDCFEFRLNEISNYGRISFTYKGEGTNPLSIIQDVEELKLEDYSVFCISKPSCGIVDLSKCNIALGNNTKSLAESSVSIGLRSTAVGITSYAEGQDTIAVGECSHAEGAFTKSNGIASHTEGFGTQTEGLSAHAEGYNTLSSGGASHSEGSATKATGLHSHAEGDTTEASGEQSHAEGKQTIAEGEHSHSEGYWTKAHGKSSHVEGQGLNNTTYSVASGDYSHSEGFYTRAFGTGSHTEGTYTIAYNKGEHAEGIYNKSTENVTLHSVGIGTSVNDRKNAHEITNDGKHYIYGVGGYDGTNPDSSDDLVTVLNKTVEYGDAIEITDSVVNVKVQENDNYLKINDSNELVVSDMKTDDTKFGKNITIAGGPFASIAKQVYTGGTVPQGTSIQEFFENLLCVEIYPTATTSSGSFSIKFTSAPSITNTNGISSGSLQEVGTKINFKEIIAKVVSESKTNPKVSGFTYGYSDTIDGTIVGGPTSITTTISASQKTGETYNLTASKSGFEGTMQTSASNTNYSSCKLSGTTLTVSYGNNSYTVSESAPKYQYSYKEITSKYIISNLGNRDENKKSPAISALLATDSNRPTTSSTFTVTGVYPIFTNGVSASTDGEVANNSSKLNAPVTGNGTKLTLMKAGSTFAISFASQTLEPYRLFLPGNWKITSAQALDGFTNKYSIDCKAKFATNGTTTRTIQGNDVTYSIYEWTGYDGANCVKFTVA